MANKCCTVGCYSNYYGAKLITVFNFPKSDNMKDLRIEFVIRKNWQPSTSSVIW